DSLAVRRRGDGEVCGLERDLANWKCAVRNEAIVHGGTPEHFELRRRLGLAGSGAGSLDFCRRAFAPLELCLPVSTDKVVPGRLTLTLKNRDQLVSTFPVVKRCDQRLDDAGSPVISARVAPFFQVVRLVNVPVTELRGFVMVAPQVNAQRNFRASQKIGELQIGGSIV